MCRPIPDSLRRKPTSTFNAQNELTADGSASLAYDSNGNTLVSDQGQTLIFDAWNRLIAVNNSSGTLIASYSYDGMGRRVIQSAPGANPVDLFYDSADQLLEQDVAASSLTLQGSYIWSAGSGYQNALLLRDFAFTGGGYNLKERTYALQDANWNVTALVSYSTLAGDTNGDGTVNFTDLGRLIQYYGHTVAGGDAVGDVNHDGQVDFSDLGMLDQDYSHTASSVSWTVGERLVYSPYGVMSVYTPGFTVTSSGDFLAWNVTFQGMLYDSATKFNFTETRVYEASTGRFLTVDPAHADGMNWYRGFADNPVNRVDPAGRASSPISTTISLPTKAGDSAYIEYLPGTGAEISIRDSGGAEILRRKACIGASGELQWTSVTTHGGSKIITPAGKRGNYVSEWADKAQESISDFHVDGAKNFGVLKKSLQALSLIGIAGTFVSMYTTWKRIENIDPTKVLNEAVAYAHGDGDELQFKTDLDDFVDQILRDVPEANYVAQLRVWGTDLP